MFTIAVISGPSVQRP